MTTTTTTRTPALHWLLTHSQVITAPLTPRDEYGYRQEQADYDDYSDEEN